MDANLHICIPLCKLIMKEIRNIIFDIGNVLLDLDFERVNREFQKLLGADFYSLSTAEATKEIFLQFEKGYYSEESFINALQRQSAKVPQGRAVIDAWNSLLLGMPRQRLDMLQALKDKGYQLYLLSNTNSLHLDWFLKYLSDEHEIQDFNERFFVKAYYSHLIKMRKPDLEVYKFVLSDAFIKADETLFIDDNEENILGARELGIATIHHNSGLDVTEVMKCFL